MKKSVLFGVLAFFAVSAMSVQNVNAQNVTVKKNAKTEQKATLSTNKAQAQPASENAKPAVKTNTQKKLTPAEIKAREAEKKAVLEREKAQQQAKQDAKAAEKKMKQDVKAADKKVKSDVKAADKQVKKEVKKGEKMTKAQRDQKVKAAQAAKAKKASTEKKVKK